jgi:hypothetical protein
MADIQTISLPAPLIQTLINYLGTKPHNEVHGLIGGIMQYAPPVQEVPKELAPTPAADTPIIDVG